MTIKSKKSKTRKTKSKASPGASDDLPNGGDEADSANEEQPAFEVALKELDVIVERMEDGDQTLEQSLDDFEQGMKLARLCERHLKTAEARVDKLMAASADADTVDFEHEA